MRPLPPWHLWTGHVDPIDGSWRPGTPWEVREGEVVSRARRTRDALCVVVVRANPRTKMLNGWRVDRTRMETRAWRATEVEMDGKPVARWEWAGVTP